MKSIRYNIYIMSHSNERAKNAEFTKDMKKTHTIYMPDMLHYHNDLLCAAFAYGGYKLKIVPEHPTLSKYAFSTIGKDYCTCATYIVGNLLTLLETEGFDIDHTAFLEPQAGGACRAGNYYNLIINCLKKSGYEQIPVLSLNAHGLEKHSGFTINPRMVFGALAAVCYSDLLMLLVQQIRPYEINKGETDKLHRYWLEKLFSEISNGKALINRKNTYNTIIADFKKIPTDMSIPKKKVGIVGEIYIKFSPIGNNKLEHFLMAQDCEYRQGGFLNYCAYVVYTEMKSMELQGSVKAVLTAYQKVIDILTSTQAVINECLETAGLTHDASFNELLTYADGILSTFYNIGDGWLIAGETIDLIKQGYDRVLMVHPFGCLVSHVAERGVLKKIHELYPNAVVSSVEFDYEQSVALRESRIMLAIK